MKKKNINKLADIHFRVTEEEKNKFKKKAVNYSSMSAMIIDAVNKFDDRVGVLKLDCLNNWSQDFKYFKSEINRVGNNINQIAHYMNVLNLQGVTINDVTFEEVKNKLDEWNEMYGKMVKLQEKFLTEIKSIL